MGMMTFTSGDSRLARTLVLLLMLCGSFTASKVCASESGVLVAAQDSPVEKISLLEIRRIYLGLEPTVDSRINQPVMNLTDPLLYRAFLRNVMHMTESGFRRKTVKRIFRQGGEKVAQIKSNSMLIEHLKNNKNDVTFMDLKTAQQSTEIKVVQVLW
jgi:hypothetical protein